MRVTERFRRDEHEENPWVVLGWMIILMGLVIVLSFALGDLPW